ncbi:MAG: response regulator [Thalassospira sp.]|nr:response regulator [Thalassospira sp.]
MLKPLTRSLARFSPAFGDLSHLEHYRPAYKQKNLADRAYLNQIGCVISIVIVTLGIPLDYVVYPEHFAQFALLRIAEDLFLLSMYFITTLQRVKPYLYLVTAAFTSSVIMTVVIIIYKTDGATSTYYAGINLVLLGVGFMLGLSFKEALFYTFLTLASYLAVSVVSGIPEGAGRIVVNNSYFIFLTGVVANIAAYFSERERFYTFCQEQEIQRKNSELKEMDRLKSEFLANVSHELRTPLTVIVGPAQQLLEKENRLPDSVREVMETVIRNGSRLIKLVNDMLELMSFEVGKREVTKTSVALDRIVNNCADQLRSLFKGKEFRELELVITEDSVPVMGNEIQLERVCFNLIQNAYKFSPEEGGRVLVSLEVISNRAILTVTDNGIGIATEHHEVIFERYRQADGSQTRRYHGTGIGLALVKEIVAAHGGEVSVQSKTGQGATFQIVLPLTEQPLAILEPATSHAPADIFRSAEANYLSNFSITRPKTRDGKKPLCLVVDDEPDMANYISTVLAPDFNVCVAPSAQKAQELVRDLKPDCVVTDQMLPGMSGTEFVAWVRRQPRMNAIPVLMLTAKNDPATKAEAERAGVDDYLLKPFDAAQLTQALHQLYRSYKEQAAPKPALVLVEDERDMAHMLKKQLEPAFAITWIENGNEAVSVIQSKRPAAVLLDHMLPEKDGIEILRELKADPELRTTPIILVTANMQDTVKQEALALGVDDFISKPFSWPELNARLSNLVKRHQLEESLAFRTEEIEQAMADLKSSEAKLIQSERWRTLHHFAGALIHEIGNPLNYALSAARIASNHSDESVRTEALADAQEGLQRIQAMVRELKDFLSPTASPSRELKPVSLKLAVERAARLNAERLSKVSFVTHEIDVEVLGSSTALVHVFSNLIDNALDALLEGHIKDPRITVDGILDKSGQFFVVSVSDNGPGVASEIQAQVFEPFIHSNKSTGLGLGLSICKTLAEKVNGHLVLEPSNTGAIFKVTLPVALKHQ